MEEKNIDPLNQKASEDWAPDSNQESDSRAGEGFLRRTPSLEKKPVHAFGHQLLSIFLNEEISEPERTGKKLEKKGIHPDRLKK